MKILFLDVDGVLNCVRCQIKTPSGYKFVEEQFLNRLKRIIVETGAKIVLSSTWRHGFYDLKRGDIDTVDAKDYILLVNKLSEFGIEIYSHTPELEEYHRGSEIYAWLTNAEETIESFVILDDDDDIYPMEGKLVRTFLDEGLQDEHVILAIEILNGIEKDFG